MHVENVVIGSIKLSLKWLRGMVQKFDLYSVALSRDSFERHIMQQSKELAFTFIMMLSFSRCIVLLNNYSTLYMAHSLPLVCFHFIK